MNRSKSKRLRETTRFRLSLIVFATLLAGAAMTSVGLMAPLPGAVFTTDVNCNGTDLNIYGSKADVYIDGGPAHVGSAGLPQGEYYVQVTEPDGTLLGTSIGTTDETPVVVNANGEFAQCYKLMDIVEKTAIQGPIRSAGWFRRYHQPGRRVQSLGEQSF
jgi:hypothetical protein